MNRKVIIGIGLGLLIALPLGYYLFFYKSPEVQKIKRSDWSKTYSIHDSGPYGLEVFYNLLDSANAENKITLVERRNLSRVLAEKDTEEHDLYIFIGNEQHLTEVDFEAINTFIKKNNSVLCINNNENQNPLFSQYNIGHIVYTEEKRMAQLKLKINKNKRLYHLPYIYKADTAQQGWKAFSIDDQFIDKKYLGEINGHTNYFKINTSGGGWYFHSNPYFFTNVSILHSEKGIAYAEDVISFLPKGNIFWDEHSKSPATAAKKITSPLQFILKNPPLLWAYGLFIFALLMHMIFNSKRKRKYIPGIDANKSQSKEFINTISEIYRGAQKPGSLIQLKEKTFLAFLNRKYFFNFKKLSQEHVQEISIKSEIAEEKVMSIIKKFEKLLASIENVKDKDLIDLNNKIEYFYQNCK